MASFLKTRSMEKYLAGLKPSCASLYSMRLDTAVVCVRSRFFSASDTFQWDPYLHSKESAFQATNFPPVRAINVKAC